MAWLFSNYVQTSFSFKKIKLKPLIKTIILKINRQQSIKLSIPVYTEEKSPSTSNVKLSIFKAWANQVSKHSKNQNFVFFGQKFRNLCHRDTKIKSMIFKDNVKVVYVI